MLKFYSKDILLQHTNLREGELKFGEVAGTVSNWEALENVPQKYVLLGIPEDIGVRANNGIAGTSEAWIVGLKALCNIQHTALCKADSVLVLGAIDCEAEMDEAEKLNPNDPHYLFNLGLLVEQIDVIVSKVVEKIVAAGKIPIVIGGGHNNSYGNLKGTASALKKALNCINFDAHSDYRQLEHRHSGNGFSYAQKDGFLENYFIFGLHRNYTSQNVYNTLAKTTTCAFSTFEEISVEKTLPFSEALKKAEQHCCQQPFGVEIDLDTVANMGSSAMTPSGFTVEECRQFTRYFSAKQNCSYIHICEGAPNRELFAGQVGKAIAYLVSDIISE